jgi:hypothetical protein
MKGAREHRVRLSGRVLAVLRASHEVRAAGEADGYVLPGQSEGKPFSNPARAMLLPPTL